MFNNLYSHQKKNYEINYRFRNKYFIFFPLYFLFICFISLVSSLLRLTKKKITSLDSHVFFSFSENQQNIKIFLNDNYLNFHFNFNRFTVKYPLSSINQNIFTIINT